MASSYSYTVLFIVFCNVIMCLCKQTNGDALSVSFQLRQRASRSLRSLNSKLSFKYSRALIVSLPIGTPPQTQDMVLDTGSQLSWIKCHNMKKPLPSPLTASFNPSRSSTFSVLSCKNPVCKPRIPDFTLPTTCDQRRLCHYSYFFADGTFAEGNLVKEKISVDTRNSISTPPLVLGCASAKAENEGILGMNLGRLSFVSQAKISVFSYCVPPRHERYRGSLYLGLNPNSKNFNYVKILNLGQDSRLPNLDYLAYTVPLQGISLNGKKLNIPATVFKPNQNGAGQTIVDSGTEYTYLMPEAYSKVKEEVLRVAGQKWKKGYIYQGSLDLCFDGNDDGEIGRLIGDLVFEFENGVKIVIDKTMTLDDVGGGIHCFGIGGSDSLGAPSNIIGNFHQQNLWVEFDLANKRVGFGRADCTK